jgi:uncharacterized SAM-binding protein YcdF (DUF218 family)
MIENLLAPDSFHLFLLCIFLLWRRESLRLSTCWRRGLLLLAAWSFFCSSPILHNALLQGLEKQYTRADISQNSDSRIVVLTSGYVLYQQGALQPRLDEHGWERLHAAVQLWRNTGGDDELIISGSLRWSHGQSVAQAMADVAVEMGVSRQLIRLEESSQTTWQSMYYLQNELVPPEASVWLVSSASHMPRAMYAAKARGLSVLPWPSDFQARDHMRLRAWLPSPGVDMQLVLHEYFGLIFYGLKSVADGLREM